MLTITLKWAKNLLLKHYLALHCRERPSLGLLEAKNEEKHQKIFYSLTRSKTNFPIFEFYFWRLFFEVIAMYLQILRKYCSFLRLHRYMHCFFGNENFAARVAKFDDILIIGLIKIYPAV